MRHHMGARRREGGVRNRNETCRRNDDDRRLTAIETK